jgi:hypothetical protein
MEKKMIEQKNEMLKKAGDSLREIWGIALMLDNTDLNGRHIDTLIKLVTNRLRSISCQYDEYLDESEIYLPEAEEAEEPTIDKDEEVTADDLPFK